MIFCGTMSLERYFEKHVSYFCAKPKKVDPIKLNFFMTNVCFDSTQIYTINNGILNTLVFGIGLPFFIENS